MKRIVILGAGGTSFDVLEALEDVNDARRERVYECIGFLDDDPAKIGREFAGHRVLGPLASAQELSGVSFVDSLGSPSNFWLRESVIARSGVPEGAWETVVHPTAVVARSAEIGVGAVILPHVVVCSRAKVGRHVVVLANSVIGHDAVIGDYGCLAAGASLSGNVRVGASCYIGSNAALREGIRVGTHALVGMGSVVVRDVPERAVVAGTPAKYLRATY